MFEIAKQYVEEVKEVEKKMFGMMGGEDIQDMDIESFKLLQSLLKLIDTTNEMQMQSAILMDEMNEKLNKLLEK